jgi:hypothetical protein
MGIRQLQKEHLLLKNKTVNTMQRRTGREQALTSQM